MATDSLAKRLFAVVDPGGRIGDRPTGLDRALPLVFSAMVMFSCVGSCGAFILLGIVANAGPGAFAFGPELKPTHVETLDAQAVERAVELDDLAMVAPKIVVNPDSIWGAIGTGCVWRPKDLPGKLWVVTNRHVLGLADHGPRGALPAISVEFHNGSRATPERVGLVRGVDLAVLEISDAGLEEGTDFRDLAPAVDSQWTHLQPSREIAMVGSMLGLDQSRSFGRIGGLREQALDIFTPAARYIQIDGTVLPGNSGGPLLLKRGELWEWIGVNTLTYEGQVGFAIHTSELFRHPIEWFRAH